MDFEDLSELIRRRRAVNPRFFTGGEITDETILRLLDNANWAPTHRHTEPWRFRVIRGEARQKLGNHLASQYKDSTTEADFSLVKYNKTLNQPMQAAAVIAICMQRDPQQRVPEWEEIAAVACAVQNLWLSAVAMGLAGYWSTPKSIVNDQIFLGLQPGERCLGLFYLGTWNPEELPTKRGAVSEKIHWKDT